MIPIDEICIISIDRSDEVWSIEGEIIYDGDISCPFEASYLPDDGEFEDITAESDISVFDFDELREKLRSAIDSYEE